MHECIFTPRFTPSNHKLGQWQMGTEWEAEADKSAQKIRLILIL